ncbi:hypothetical protein JL721_3203 [Aureococcus anophagefferens]|nr:hypothetical protein JL721_3203 [Aureococcus anophagefferens]
MADFVLRVQPQQSPEKPELNDQYNQALGHLGYADLAQHTSSDRTAADSRIGLALLEETADAGFAPAQFVLAQLCDGRRRDVPRNDEMQFRWAEASAAQNMPEAQLLLSNLYVRGRGCSPNRIRSLQWLRTAADAKYLPALVRVGLYYLEDGAYPEAEQFFRQALELRGDDGLRDADALYYLGHMVCEGAGRGRKRARKLLSRPVSTRTGGVAKNTAEGRMLLREAAERGHHEAAADLVATAAPKKGGFLCCASSSSAAATDWIGPTINMTAKDRLVVIRSDEEPVVVRPFEPMQTPVATAVVADEPVGVGAPGAPPGDKAGLRVDAVGTPVEPPPAPPPAPPDDDLGEWVTRFNSEGSSSMAMRPKEPELPPPPEVSPEAAADPTALLENDQANCFIDFSFAFCGKSQDKPAAPARTAPDNLFGDNGEDYEETDHLVDDEIPMSYVCAPNC